MPNPYSQQAPVNTRSDFYGFGKKLKIMESYGEVSFLPFYRLK